MYDLLTDPLTYWQLLSPRYEKNTLVLRFGSWLWLPVLTKIFNVFLKNLPIICLKLVHTTVGIYQTIGDLNTSWTSKLGWRYLIGMNSRISKIHKKEQEQKWLKNWTILKNLKKIKFQPCSQPRDLLMTGQMPYKPLRHNIWMLINKQKLEKLAKFFYLVYMSTS